jgi:hypothetical protein
MELNRDELEELQTIRRKIQGLIWEAAEIMESYMFLQPLNGNEMKDAIDEMENELAEYESERG